MTSNLLHTFQYQVINNNTVICKTLVRKPLKVFYIKLSNLYLHSQAEKVVVDIVAVIHLYLVKVKNTDHMKASLGLASGNLASSETSLNVTIFVSFGRTVGVDTSGGRLSKRVFSAWTSFSRRGWRSAPFRISFKISAANAGSMFRRSKFWRSRASRQELRSDETGRPDFEVEAKRDPKGSADRRPSIG